MMESYKKFILVGLIHCGKIPTLPKYTSHVVAKYIKPLCQSYHELANIYGTKGPEELRAVMTKFNDTFTSDNNLGLVKQCLTSLYKKNIQRLTKTFLTLSLADVAQRVQLAGPREAEKYILHMIEDGEIYANINQKDGMVIFQDNPEKYNNVSMLTKLDTQMERCMQLDDQLKSMDRDIAVNASYVQKSVKNQDVDM